MRKITALICLIALLSVTVLVMPAFASNTTISVSKIPVVKNQVTTDTVISIPLTILGNNGIAGMELKLTYDNNLVLTNIRTGTSLKKLNFTKPGNLAANPCTLLWDGQDADNSNGNILILEFTLRQVKTGKYPISVSYNAGGVYDQNLNDVTPDIVNGCILVNETTPELIMDDYTQSSNTVSFEISLPSEPSGNLIAAIYDINNRLVDVQIVAAKDINSFLLNKKDGVRIKVLWLDYLLYPLASFFSKNI